MGTNRYTDTAHGRLSGMVVHDPRIIEANLRTNDGATGNSSYTQAGPRPGTPVPPSATAKLVPRITGQQSANTALIRVAQAGVPGRGEDACHVAWRQSISTEDDDDYRGWNPHIHLSSCPNPVTFGTSFALYFDAVTPRNTQLPCVVYTRTSASVHDLRARVWNATTWAWGTEVDIDTQIGVTVQSTGGPICVVALPVSETVERLIAYYTHPLVGDDVLDSVSSIDGGTTWARYSLSAATYVAPVTTPTKLRGCVVRGDVGLLLLEGSSGDWLQLASGNGGVRFDSVASGSAIGQSISYCALPNGEGAIIAYREQATNQPTIRRITGPYQPYSDASAVTVSATALAELTAWVDWDGVVWVAGRQSAAGLEDTVSVWYSTDNGDTWSAFTTDTGVANSNTLLATGDASSYFSPSAACPASGAVFLFGTTAATGTGTTPNDIQAVIAGGWSTLSAHHGESTLPGDSAILTYPPGRHRRTHMMGWGYELNDRGRTWFPFELPQDLPYYTLTGTSGTITATGLQISTAAATGYATDAAWLDTSVGAVSGLFEMQVDSGGSSSNNACSIGIRLANGVSDLEVSLRFDTSSLTVRDVNSGLNLGNVSVTLTTWLQVSVYLAYGSGTNDGYLEVWYKRPADTLWTELLALADPNGPMNDSATPNAASQLEWGHRVNTTTVSRWRQVHYRGAESGVSEAHWRYDPKSRLGHPVSTLPYPVPELGTSTGSAFLRGEAGPGVVDEVYTIAPHFDHPVGAMFPASPDPGRRWRSTGTASAVRFAFDLGIDSALGASYSVGLYIGETNVQAVQLLGWDGAAYQTLGTLDLRVLTGVQYRLIPAGAGDILRPDTGTPDVVPLRYLQRDELAGGFALTDTGGSPLPRRIVGNTGGVWHATGTPGARIRISATGAEVQDAQVSAYTRRGLLIVHLAANTYYDRFAVNITANQSNPDGYYEIGTLRLGAFVGFGRRPSAGWTKRRVPQVERRTIRGVERVRKLADNVDEWSLAWVDAIDLLRLRQRAVSDVDYLGTTTPASAHPSVAVDDVWWQALGILGETEGGTLPVVVVEEAVTPDDGTIAATLSITDPTMFLSGWATGAVEARHVVGDEGTGPTGEVIRVEALTVRGDPRGRS